MVSDQAVSGSRSSINSSTKSKVSLEELIKIIDKSELETETETCSKSDEVFEATNKSLSRKSSIASFDETANNDSHDYVNTPNNVRFAKKSEVR